jgi:hypothetical protein
MPQRAVSLEDNSDGGATRCNELRLFLPICADNGTPNVVTA